jgi:hypothetical protein
MQNKIDYITFELIKSGIRKPSKNKILKFCHNILHVCPSFYELEFIQSHYNF